MYIFQSFLGFKLIHPPSHSQRPLISLHSNPERDSGGGAPDALITGGIMAMRAQRRTVIDQMYIEDTDVMNVLRIIMGGPGCLQIAKNYKNKFGNREVYLLIGKNDTRIGFVIAYCSQEGKDVSYSFDKTVQY